jgi:two-component system, sensor histidine kinase
MTALLGGWGCIPLVATDLAEALAAASQSPQRPNAILADYHLDADAYGDVAISEIRKSLNAELPAIVISADRQAQLREKLQAAGFHHLNKPVRPAQLRALLSRLI